jgi:hypothetical protein
VTVARIVLIAVVVGGLIAWFLSEFFIAPEFMLLAAPGIFFSMALSLHAMDPGIPLMFVGNWMFYTALAALVLMVWRRLRARKFSK